MIAGLYLHIPFCLVKCNYCDFNSYAGCSTTEKEEYLQTLLTEAKSYASLLGEHVPSTEVLLDSVYLGGGTPTCLSGGQLCFLLQAIRNIFPCRQNAEITIEGNPGTLDLTKLRELRKGGFNRLSLGAQSFQQKELSLLGRIHTAAETRQAFKLARQAGFSNIGLDLMYGLPGQGLTQWQANLEEVLALKPEHISLYQLKIEAGTPFYQLLQAGEIFEFPDDLAALMYDEAGRFLGEAGYQHYEISNFALPGFASRHNQLYWHNEEYLGLGAGAAGYWHNMRYSNIAKLDSYTALALQGGLPRESEELIGSELQLAEAIFLGLRLTAGLDKEQLFLRYGVKIEERFGETITKLKKQGLLAENEKNLFLTAQGRKLANLVFMEFLP